MPYLHPLVMPRSNHAWIYQGHGLYLLYKIELSVLDRPILFLRGLTKFLFLYICVRACMSAMNVLFCFPYLLLVIVL